jgi:hypothetical protein
MNWTWFQNMSRLYVTFMGCSLAQARGYRQTMPTGRSMAASVLNRRSTRTRIT